MEHHSGHGHGGKTGLTTMMHLSLIFPILKIYLFKCSLHLYVSILDNMTSLGPVVTNFDIHTGNSSSNMNRSWQKNAFLYYFAKVPNVEWVAQ